jgi:hypothetical protein
MRMGCYQGCKTPTLVAASRHNTTQYTNCVYAAPPEDEQVVLETSTGC